MGNRVDIPTIHSADPLIFPLPKHCHGQVHCPDERLFIYLFMFCKPDLFSQIFSSSLVKTLE